MEWDVCAHLLLHSLPLKMVRDAFLFQNHGDFFCHSLLLCHQMCTALVFLKKKKSSGPGKKGQKKEEKSESQLLAMLPVRAVCHAHQVCLAVCEGMC